MIHGSRQRFMELADRLEKDAVKYAEVIENLRDLEYDDFASNKFSLPKVQMISDLEAIGQQAEADRVRKGYYDQ